MGPLTSRPRVITTVSDLRDAVAAARSQGKRIGLVPTMGALHTGHLSLVRASQAECDFTVVSIFVNPSQFAPSEDFRRYPRNLEADVEALASCGADLVFAPANEEVYPPGFATWVEVGSVAKRWEGECRPGHFRGVATVVFKLFQMVLPDLALFGQKDFQQARVIRQMVDDLNIPVGIRICPTIRESDGLAMSSRNLYLAPEARRDALAISHGLRLAFEMVAQGHRAAAPLIAKIRELILAVPAARIDYVAIVDPETLEAVEEINQSAVALVAAVIGQTRLIDNTMLIPPVHEDA